MDSPLEFAEEVTLAFGVHDRTASAAWYAERLGFQLLYDAPEIGWCAMATHVPRLVVGFSDVEAPKPGGPVPTVDVVDHDASRAWLESAGVRFDGPPVEHEGLARLSTFYDPDGHAWMLAQALAPEG
jgi:CreA protein